MLIPLGTLTAISLMPILTFQSLFVVSGLFCSLLFVYFFITIISLYDEFKEEARQQLSVEYRTPL